MKLWSPLYCCWAEKCGIFSKPYIIIDWKISKTTRFPPNFKQELWGERERRDRWVQFGSRKFWQLLIFYLRNSYFYPKAKSWDLELIIIYLQQQVLEFVWEREIWNYLQIGEQIHHFSKTIRQVKDDSSDLQDLLTAESIFFYRVKPRLQSQYCETILTQNSGNHGSSNQKVWKSQLYAIHNILEYSILNKDV